MDYVYIGKLVNTHGIKGEVRILSNFEYKDKVFVKEMPLYIGENKEKVTISAYRPHKNFDMCMFKEYNYINDVIKFKGKKVYILRDSLDLKEKLLDEDFISLRCIYKNKTIGYITSIINNNGYKLFDIDGKYVPFNENFLERIDIQKKEIYLKNLEGLI